ncbi:unnamed protein product [Echinostoma caproni]|uniref:Derlin n=1 Tax=Echinostoma caproni TaxID=27848 RepID=A0A183A2X3_9TREM|nr:unnamed protein product [Echinostoma caproni]
MPGNELSDFFNNIPLVTRYWFSGTILFSLLGRLGLIDPMNMILLWSSGYKFQIWRPITALLFYPVNPQTGFHFLINLYFLYSYSSRLESGMFFGRTADYVFLMSFCWILNVVSFRFVGFNGHTVLMFQFSARTTIRPTVSCADFDCCLITAFLDEGVPLVLILVHFLFQLSSSAHFDGFHVWV